LLKLGFDVILMFRNTRCHPHLLLLRICMEEL